MDILLLKARTVRKQATVVKIQKNTEQNARYLLTILIRRIKMASSKQPAHQKIVSKMLTILTAPTKMALSKQPSSKFKKILSKMLTICSLFRPVENSQPEALCELHGYVYNAKVRIAEVFEVLGDPARA